MSNGTSAYILKYKNGKNPKNIGNLWTSESFQKSFCNYELPTKLAPRLALGVAQRLAKMLAQS